jgi:hypothetical protein
MNLSSFSDEDFIPFASGFSPPLYAGQTTFLHPMHRWHQPLWRRLLGQNWVLKKPPPSVLPMLPEAVDGPDGTAAASAPFNGKPLIG